MKKSLSTAPPVRPQTTPVGRYQAPRIETVLSADDLEREVLYAGVIPASGIAAA